MYTEIFRQGTLNMSLTPVPETAAPIPWQDLNVNKILVLVCIVLVLSVLKDFISLFPQLLDGLDRPKGNSTLEHSVGMSRSRNIIASVMILPFCLIIDRFAIIRPKFWSLIPAEWSVAATVGLLLSFLIVRGIFFNIFRPRRLSSESSDTVHHCLYNVFILLSVLMMASAGIVSIFHISGGAARSIIYIETGLFYLISLVRTGQILRTRCSGLSTFLYFCTLEMLPASILGLCILFL